MGVMRSPSLKPALAQLPPHLYPPAGAQSKNLANYIPVPNPGITAIIFQFTVPTSMRLILNQIGNNFAGGGFVEGSGDLVWQIQDNQLAIEDFENIIGSLGNVALPTPMAPITIEEGHTVSFVVTNMLDSPILGGSGQVGATLRGWYYNLLEAGYSEWAV
jgi:hypothetical protein